MTRLIPTFLPTLKSVRLLTILLLLVPALVACGQSQSQPQASAPPPPPVTIAQPVSKIIADQDEYVGRFFAVESAEERARGPAYPEPIPFHAPPTTHAGAILFTTTRQPF